MKELYPVEPTAIKEYLCEQWRKEFPEQNPHFPRAYQWEYRMLPVDFFKKSIPPDMAKAEKYLRELLAGAQFPPLVYLAAFGDIINGLHRLWAFQQAGIFKVPTYIGKD